MLFFQQYKGKKGTLSVTIGHLVLIVLLGLFQNFTFDQKKITMEQQSLTFDTKIGIVGGSLLSVLANIHITDIEKTVLLGALGTLVSFVVSLVCKGIWEMLKKYLKSSQP